MSRFLVDSVASTAINSTTISVTAPTGLADGDDVWVVVVWTHPNNAGDTITFPGVNVWRQPTATGTFTTSSAGTTSRVQCTVARANTGVSSFGGSYAVADQGAGPWTFTFSSAANATAIAFAFRGHSSAQTALAKEGSFWPTNTASITGIAFGGFAGTPVYEEAYVVSLAGYNNTADPTLTFVDDDQASASLEDSTVDDATVTLRRIHAKAWSYGDANALQAVTDAPTASYTSTITGATTFASRRGQYGLVTIKLGTLVPGVTAVHTEAAVPLNLPRVKYTDLPYEVHTKMGAR